MFIINPFKPFYIDKNNKIIRMGNFESTGKELEYEDDEFIKIFDYLKKPISKKDLVNKICDDKKFNRKEVLDVIDYLKEERFIIEKKSIMKCYLMINLVDRICILI